MTEIHFMRRGALFALMPLPFSQESEGDAYKKNLGTFFQLAEQGSASCIIFAKGDLP
jgi:hypothetical protein